MANKEKEKRIWDTLLAAIGNPYGAAGLMGNLFAESSLNEICKTGGSAEIKAMSREDYVNKVDSGEFDCDTFSHDGVAFGLAQWRYWSRKEQLYLFYISGLDGDSIGDLNMQLKFLIKEIQTYKTVWKTLQEAKTVKEASDIVLEKYEKPASVSDKTKEKRAAFGQGYFDSYARQEEKTPMTRYIETTKANVNLRTGNGKNYSKAGVAIQKGSRYEWVATSDNGWHAVVAKSGKQVVWISGDFSKIVEE